MSNGVNVQINSTGTLVKFKPGIVTSGAHLKHACPVSRSIGYFVEGILPLALFGKKALGIAFTGVTNANIDPSVDVIRTVTLHLLKYFKIEGEIKLEIVSRGAPPLGGGLVTLKCPIVKQLSPVTLVDSGKIKRVRGLAYTTRCSSQFSNRMVESARGVLNAFIPDVYIYTDHFKGKNSGLSPGYAVSLLAESTSGCLLSAQRAADPITSTTQGVASAEAKLSKPLFASSAGSSELSSNNNTELEDALSWLTADKKDSSKKKQKKKKKDTKRRFSDVDGDSDDNGDDKLAKRQRVGPAKPLRLLPEDLGVQCAKLLVEEIGQGGVVDSAHQSLMLLLMVLCPENVSKIRLGKLSPYTIEALRLFKAIFGVTFKIVPDRSNRTVILSCMGIGFKNFSRKAIYTLIIT
jgi:RNA 3'-terminal phosphate cyclase-like protein